MKNKIITTVIGALFALPVFAQQGVLLSQYFFDPLYINPAYAGSRGTLSGTLTYRDQWVGVSGSPVTEGVNLHAPVPSANIGLGLQLDNDVAGPLRISTVAVDFAYYIHITKETKLAFGLAGSLNDVAINDNIINIENPDDPAFPAGTSSVLLPDANFGIYLYRNTFYLGVAADHLIQPALQSQFEALTSPGLDFERQYFLTSGIVFGINNYINIRPSILVQYVQTAPALVELDATFIFWDKLYVGAGLRNNERIGLSGTDNYIVPSVEYDLQNSFRFGYSYDISLSNGDITNGTHEIMVGWDFGADKLKKENPRYF